MSFAMAGQLTMHYMELGDGDPILFIPGGGMDYSCWLPLADFLKTNRRCIMLDNRGVGQTEKPTPPYSMSGMAQDALKILDSLEIDACHVVGHSMGGYIAQEMALTAGERCRSLTLIGSGTGPTEVTIFLMELRMQLARKLDRRLFLESVAGMMFSPATFEQRRELVDGFIEGGEKNPQPQPVYAYEGHLNACIAFSSRDRYSAIQSPTLVMVGDSDLITPPGQARELARQLSHKEAVTIADAGHMVLVEQPRILAQEMEAFFGSL